MITAGLPVTAWNKAWKHFMLHMTYRMNSFHRLMDSGITEYGKYEEVVASIKDYYEYAIPCY